MFEWPYILIYEWLIIICFWIFLFWIFKKYRSLK